VDVLLDNTLAQVIIIVIPAMLLAEPVPGQVLLNAQAAEAGCL